MANYFMSLQDARFEAKRARKFNDVTNNDIAYYWSLAGINGASFVLFKEKHHTSEDIEKAKAELRFSRDVVGGIGIERI